MIFRTKISDEFYTDERCFITEILNTNEIQHISIARARVEPDVTTELHVLNVDELYYILEGVGAIEINDSLKEEVKKGDIALIKAGSSQRITNIANSDLIFLCICVPKFNANSYTSLEKKEHGKI